MGEEKLGLFSGEERNSSERIKARKEIEFS
jgi:hypothetical protein